MLAEWAAHPSQPIQPTSTNQKALFAPVNLMHFIENIKISMNPFCVKKLKTNFNVLPYGGHGPDRVQMSVRDKCELTLISCQLSHDICKLRIATT
jgi:hypothetical protein